MKCILIAMLCLLPGMSWAQPELSYVRGTVEAVTVGATETVADISRTVQEAQIRLLEGADQDTIITIENGILNNREDMRLETGETVVLQRITKPDGTLQYLIREKYRLPSLFVLLGFFFILGVVLGGKIGFTSIIGLAVSIGILISFVIPKIVSGSNPLFISLLGSGLIACTSLYLAHGFNRRTTIALLSTIITLSLSTFLALAFVSFGKLFGMGSEESVFLQMGTLQIVNLRGLLLGGIIIGALGVLDDITTAQTAAVDELSKANHDLGFAELYKAGTSIGREHIASLINTLALAYVGASLPILLLFSINQEMPWWAIVNSEFVAEEIVRTLVGSSTLLLAVPISTWIAAKQFAHGRHTNVQGCGHVH